MKILIALLLLAPGLTRADDWRVDLLAEAGFGTTEADLRKALEAEELDRQRLATAYGQLGSESYPERQRAEKAIISAGPDALAWLRQQPPTDDPEIQLRVGNIRRVLELNSDDRRDRMIVHAARSLLAEIGKPSDPATGGLFYEWFGDKIPELGKRHRQFQFKAPPNMSSRIEEGALVHEGQRAGNDDQRLILRSTSWPGTETFPNQFTVTTTVQSTAGGSGAWHLGIGIGGIRVLYHPDYGGGGFRYERIEDNMPLSENQPMGFTPGTGKPQQIRVSVLRQGDESVRLSVVVRQEGSEPFEQTTTIAADSIGPLTEVSLDRSGRSGGDARFSELMIELDSR